MGNSLQVIGRIIPKAKMEQAMAFVEEFAVQIAEKWYRFYILKETLTPEKINKKI
jgi:hypothetical protein